MLRPSAKTSHALLAVIALACVPISRAAETDKEKRAALVGLTREQVYAKLGDPRNLMKAGPREIMFFPHLKLTLRNGKVIEAEEVFDDPVTPAPRRPAADVAPSTPVAPVPEATPTPAPAKAPGAVPAPDAPVSKATPAAAPTPEPAPAVAAPAPSLEIKSVRPPSAGGARPATKAPAKAPDSSAAVVSVTAPAAPPPAKAPAPVAPKPGPTTPAQMAPVASSAASTMPEPAAMPAVEKASEAAPGTAEAVESEAKPVKPAPKRSLFRRHTAGDDDLPEPSLFTTQTFVLAAVLAGAIGYLVWRRRQRSLELEATTVSSTPFDEAAPADNSAMFNAELLAKLEWKRFEELVAAYYIKTGVVAVRTNAGPDAAVHLKISWKGETKPFAGVLCISNPPSLIRSGPLQQLADALTAADIRRGYVVTNGKFNVEARDLASEKHFTLLSGDILLEKLNALPPAARTELMQEITKGDYTTPTCPKCDVKMVRADENSWRCANHPRCEQTIPPRKA